MSDYYEFKVELAPAWTESRGLFKSPVKYPARTKSWRVGTSVDFYGKLVYVLEEHSRHGSSEPRRWGRDYTWQSPWYPRVYCDLDGSNTVGADSLPPEHADYLIEKFIEGIKYLREREREKKRRAEEVRRRVSDGLSE